MDSAVGEASCACTVTLYYTCRTFHVLIHHVSTVQLSCTARFGPCGGLTLAAHEMPTKLLYHSPPQQDRRMRKQDGKSPSWQFNKAKAKAAHGTKENKSFILYFPLAGNIQPFPRK